jgi:hypothetical protein
MTAAGQTPADVAYQMDVGGVSPAELPRLLLERPLGKFKPNTINHAQEVCLVRGRLLLGVYLKTSPFKPVLMERQSPTFFTPDPAKTTSPSESSSANANQPGSINGGSGGSGGEVGFDQNENGRGFGGGSNSFGMSASNLGNAIAQGVDALGLTSVFAPSLVSEEDAAPIETASFSPGQGLGSGYLSVDDSNAAAG